MAEIGIIASIIGVAGAGFRLSLILNAVGCEVASAGVEIHSISKGVTLFSLMLKQIGQTLQAADSVHSQEALDTARHITDECKMIFGEIEDMLDRVQTRKEDGSVSPTIQQRFKWCFKKHRVTYLLAQLESLKMSLLVMLQILQLGKMMASTSKSDALEEAAIKKDMIQQERAETQNIVIVRYWQNSRLDRLFDAAEREDWEDRKIDVDARNNGMLTNGQPQLALEAPMQPAPNSLARLHNVSFGQLDDSLERIRESPKDMVRVSDSVIDPLLDRWTRWQEARERGYGRRARRYAPSVHDIYDSEEEKPRGYKGDFDRDDSPHGYYLEGVTTDWRKPHSAAARRERSNLRKQYAGYQPSVSVESDSDNQRRRSQKKRSSRRHVINSSDESTSESSPDPQPRQRRGSGLATEKRTRFEDEKSRSQPHGPEKPGHQSKYSTSSTNTSYSNPRSSPQSPMNNRPIPHHSFSAPLPPLHTGTVQNAWAPGSPFSPPPPPYPGTNVQPQAFSPRPAPPGSQRLSMPGQPTSRPSSQDGKARSPSRMSQRSSASHASHKQSKEEKEEAKKQSQRSLRKNATRSILGAGAIAGFLEALEGLSI
ncbi:MAG: hypothetical protein Q9227_000031 [Pyrenula ochraceoflavens]